MKMEVYIFYCISYNYKKGFFPQASTDYLTN